MTASERVQRKGLRARFSAAVWRLVSDRSGAVAIEYIVAGALIAVGVIAGVSLVSEKLTGLYGSVIAKFAG